MRTPKLVLPSLTLIAGCCAFVAKPLHRPSASSTFGNTSKSNTYRGKREYRTAVNPRRIKSRIYSIPYLPNIDEGDDGSFFISASQQAAKDRYEMLKQGKDPLAISLSTASIEKELSQNESINVEENIQSNESSEDDDSNNTDTTSTLTLEKNDYNDLLTSLSGSPMTEETTGAGSGVQKSSKSTANEIKRVEDEIAAVNSQINARMNIESEKRAGEGSTAEEMEATRNARLAAADNTKKILEDEKQVENVMGTSCTDSASITHAGEGSTAEEMEEARNLRLAAADEIAIKLKKTAESSKAAATDTIEEETKDEANTAPEEEAHQESSRENASVDKEENTNKSKLSSDGKAIYEPSQSQLDMNQEIVQNGLMVLTRSFLVLNSVVDRLTEGKK